MKPSPDYSENGNLSVPDITPRFGATALGHASSVFFVSDVRSAAEGAAFSLEQHGLTPEQTDDLAEKIEERITAWFGGERDVR